MMMVNDVQLKSSYNLFELSPQMAIAESKHPLKVKYQMHDTTVTCEHGLISH